MSETGIIEAAANVAVKLPGLNCGVCGYRTCDEFAVRLEKDPGMIKRCIHVAAEKIGAAPPPSTCASATNCGANSAHGAKAKGADSVAAVCGECARSPFTAAASRTPWVDSLGREFDFYLEHFPEDAGPREVIIPHNPMLTREMNIQPGDILIGRPLGMSCGCPITHCGVATVVDHRTGVLTWCVTGPLQPREKGYKDMGYYIAEAYEGLVTEPRTEIKIGMRYFFQPRMCMLQWRHSGLVNYINRSKDALQIRIEGLWIG